MRKLQSFGEFQLGCSDFGADPVWLPAMTCPAHSRTGLSAVNANSNMLLGGSFFCSRSTGINEQRDVSCIVPTLALLLSRQSVQFRRALAAELARDPDVLHKQVATQVERLLYRPLHALKGSKLPVIFVIDALDECGGQVIPNGAHDAESHRIVSDMLKALIAFSDSTSDLPVKFLVTSRPETHIRDTLASDHSNSKVLRLHTVDMEQVSTDIRLYISSRLYSTPTLRSLFVDEDVDMLVQLCDGLFIVAATALQYALGGGADVAEQRFTTLLNASRDSLSIRATGGLDYMYGMILEDAAKEDEIAGDRLPSVLHMLATLLSARMILSVSALSELLEVPTRRLHARMDRLHAVVHVPDEDNDPGLRTLHASFGDYLFGRAPINVRIPESLGHKTLAQACLHIMEKRLYFNVSRSGSSYETSKKPDSVTLSLEYACMHWVYHTSPLPKVSKTVRTTKGSLCQLLLSCFPCNSNSPKASELEVQIGRIFCPRLLFWLEVMVVLGQVRRAAAMLTFAAASVSQLSQ